MSVQAVSSIQNNVQKPIQQPVEAKKPEQKEGISDGTKLLLGSLVALAVGAGIYFATRGKVGTKSPSTPNLSENKFKTIIKKDGSMERLFPNGNTVSIRETQDPDGWSRVITVKDSNGKKICERRKKLGKHSDYSIFMAETNKAYNSDGNSTIKIHKNIYKTNDKTKITINEYNYNEKGDSLDDTSLLKQKTESKTNDKNGKLIEESSVFKERNKFDSFDEHEYNMYLPKEKEGVIRTSTTHREYIENGIKKTNHIVEDVDANGNRLWDNQQFIIENKNKNIGEMRTLDYHYIINNQGKPILKDDSYYSYEIYPLNDYKDYISHYSETYDAGEGPFSLHPGQALYKITDYKRNEDGVGLLQQYWKDLEGKVIESSRKQKQGKDVKWDTII